MLFPLCARTSQPRSEERTRRSPPRQGLFSMPESGGQIPKIIVEAERRRSGPGGVAVADPDGLIRIPD